MSSGSPVRESPARRKTPNPFLSMMEPCEGTVAPHTRGPDDVVGDPATEAPVANNKAWALLDDLKVA